MRHEPGGVEAEVVMARALRNGWCRCTIDDERFDVVPMLELACDSESGRAGPDDNCVAASQTCVVVMVIFRLTT
jgi:hypothetical protein